MTLAWKPLTHPKISVTNWFTSKNQSSYSCAINFPHSFLIQASFHLPMSGLEWFVRKQYDSRQEASPTLRSTCFLTSIIQGKQSTVQLFSIQESISNRFGTLMSQKNCKWLLYKNGTDIWGVLSNWISQYRQFCYREQYFTSKNDVFTTYATHSSVWWPLNRWFRL